MQPGKEGKAFEEATTKSARKSANLKHLIIDTKDNEHALKFFGLETKDVPTIVVQNDQDEKFIKTNAAASDISSFVAQFEVHLPGLLSECHKTLLGSSMAIAKYPLDVIPLRFC